MEQAEFEHIATRIRQRAVATALAFAASGDEAEDIAQETMLKLWTLRTEICDTAHAEKLASCIAHNRAIDYIRRRRTISLDAGRSIIDDKTVITGSYNYSRNAEERNDENIVILRCPAIAHYYTKEFKRCISGTKGY